MTCSHYTWFSVAHYLFHKSRGIFRYSCKVKAFITPTNVSIVKIIVLNLYLKLQSRCFLTEKLLSLVVHTVDTVVPNTSTLMSGSEKVRT